MADALFVYVCVINAVTWSASSKANAGRWSVLWLALAALGIVKQLVW